MIKRMCLAAILLFLIGCTSSRTGEALQAIGTWDVAAYGAYADVAIKADSANFTIPGVGVPMSVQGLDVIVKVKIGKYAECPDKVENANFIIELNKDE